MHSFDWRVEDSKHVIQDQWISLRADTCRMPNGRLVAPYYVLEYPTWVNVVALTEQHDVVLVKQYRHGLGKTALELPCGGVEKDDISPYQAIKRELLEETGYTSDDVIETGRISPNPANHNNITHCFLARSAKRVASPAFDETEQIETVLMPLNTVITLVTAGDIFQALHISSLFLAIQHLGGMCLSKAISE
jgi:ADP-ribose pyrophosphatase